MSLAPSLAHRRLAATLAALALTTTGLGVAASAEAQTVPAAGVVAAAHPGLDRLLRDGTPTGMAIVELDRVPTLADVSALTTLGLRVQPMKALPMAVVEGPRAAMAAAVTTGLADDVYPDEKLGYLDTESSNASSSTAAAAAGLRSQGLTGKGVTVAVVDSGCNAMHPDLAKRVKVNVKLVSGEYANQGTGFTFAVPGNQGPGTNTDIGGGHGTHVAGIIAADSSSVTDGSRLGVAPGADLACFAIGEGLFTTAVVTAFDYMIDDKVNKKDSMSIDVVNNSWGNSYRQLDPSEPMGVASKALADRGVVIVFAAGNSGGGNVPMSLNPFSQFPWVISVAAGTIKRERGDFSSNGLVHDNSQSTAIGPEGHTVFTGDRIGEVHPDVMSPGVAIASSCNPLGTVVMCDDPTDPNGQSRISGTSMASPAVAGAVAVLLQANPRLTITEVRQALQATATPDTNVVGTGTAARTVTTPFWQTGYGFVNLDRAVALVQRPDWQAALAAESLKADQRVLDADGVAVVRSDLFTRTPPPATAGGSDSQTFTVPVQAGVGTLGVSLAFPSGGTVGSSLFSYTATVKAPDGTVLGTSTTDTGAGSGTALLTVDLAAKRLGAGSYTVSYAGDYAASDPDTLDSDSVLGRAVTLQVAQLRAGSSTATAPTTGTTPAPTTGAGATTGSTAAATAPTLARSRISLLRPRAWQVRGSESARIRYIVRAAKQPVSSGTVTVRRDGKRVAKIDLARTRSAKGFRYYRVPSSLALGRHTFTMSYTSDAPAARTSARSRTVVLTVVTSRPRADR